MPRSISLVASLVLFTLTSNAAFLAIDYGSEWTKASLMTPGRKIDILLNTDSKRKVHSTVSWNKEDRLFGSDAFNSAARFPLDTFPYLKTLVGARCPSSQSSYYSQLSRAQVVEDAKRGMCSLKRADGSIWSVEELIAMEFTYMKGLAEAEAKEKVSEAVVTVPPFYTQFERQSVLDALEIAGLRPIALINDGLAVAINYATTRTFKDQEYHIIYDAGASSTTATLVSFSSQSPSTGKKSSSKDVTTIEVKSFGFDSKAGGADLDRRLRDYLLERLQSKHQLSLTDNDRAMARVWKEAQRVKGVLSANADSTIRLESISGDIDFKDTISRATFEGMAKDLLPRFSQPITDALNAANLKLTDIKSVILVGGASRTPMVQSAVKALAGDSKVALGVNADEAAVLGAAFYGATTKTSWRTKPMRFLDVNAYDMQMKYLKEGSNKQLTSVVLPSMSKLGRQNFKLLTFPKRTQDFEVELEYKSLPNSEIPKAVVQAKLSGVAGALANLTSQGVQTPQVRVSFGYSDSGLAVVEDAVAVGELTRVVEPPKSTSANKKAKSTESQTTTSTTESQPSTTAASEEAPKYETVAVTAPIELQITPLSISPLSTTEKRASQSRLAEIAARETAKVQREQAYNLLEGFLYRLRDLFEDDSSAFHEFAQPDEQTRLSDKLATTMTWLHDKGDEASADVLFAKRAELETMEQPIITRYKEASTGPKALSDLQKAHALARAFLTEANVNQTAAIEAGETPRFTEDDLKTVDRLVTESENWLRERTQQQKKLTKRQDPVLKTAEMESKGLAIQKSVQGLQRRKPIRPKTTSSTKSATATPTPTTESAESQSTDKENRSREEL
ncbi:hypothetical protein M407DRAFT_15428 [Tulasnella calospora MUT 4182]|uniref:Actin-like ATPase domain-containing protein n=1 Tax=Tulasnella calospora MUT 4182 TaxID=1051891 RepID=A0A0C3Q5G4_9AGAM|nr:hypothetical protein M407DRAFT_15428 [Tulasnella calospora MUT 4182]